MAETLESQKLKSKIKIQDRRDSQSRESQKLK